MYLVRTGANSTNQMSKMMSHIAWYRMSCHKWKQRQSFDTLTDFDFVALNLWHLWIHNSNCEMFVNKVPNKKRLKNYTKSIFYFMNWKFKRILGITHMNSIRLQIAIAIELVTSLWSELSFAMHFCCLHFDPVSKPMKWEQARIVWNCVILWLSILFF